MGKIYERTKADDITKKIEIDESREVRTLPNGRTEVPPIEKFEKMKIYEKKYLYYFCEKSLMKCYG